MRTSKFCSIAFIALSLLLLSFTQDQADVLQLLGQRVSSKAAKEIIRKSGEKIIYKSSDCYYYMFESAGLDLMMNNHDTITTIFLFAEDAEHHKQYASKLPVGLQFSQDRKEIETLLGPPEKTGGEGVISYYCDWKTKGISITYNTLDTADMSARIHTIAVYEKEK